MLENRDVWPGMNAQWTLSNWKAGFLWASCYCPRALATTQLLFDFSRSVHIPNLFYAIAHLATAHRWQWDCYTVDILTCPSRKRTGRMNDSCIPILGAPAIVHWSLCLIISTCVCPPSTCPTEGSVAEAWALMSRLESHHQGDHTHLVLLREVCGSPSPGFHWCMQSLAHLSLLLFCSTQQQGNIFNRQFSHLIHPEVSACPVSLMQS